jgi:hypothetical protein
LTEAEFLADIAIDEWPSGPGFGQWWVYIREYLKTGWAEMSPDAK